MTLEELLNKLIEKGWKPWGRKKDDFYYKCIHIKENDSRKLLELHRRYNYTLNDLCSIESGLWQFVCGLDNDYLQICSKCNISIESNNDEIKSDSFYEEEYEYRVMLSSIQEDKEKFLLDNIKITCEHD